MTRSKVTRSSSIDLHEDAGRWVPDAFTSRQVGVHVLFGTRLDYLHPLHPEIISKSLQIYKFTIVQQLQFTSVNLQIYKTSQLYQDY